MLQRWTDAKAVSITERGRNITDQGQMLLGRNLFYKKRQTKLPALKYSTSNGSYIFSNTPFESIFSSELLLYSFFNNDITNESSGLPSLK
jgi:hypothetical protein